MSIVFEQRLEDYVVALSRVDQDLASLISQCTDEEVSYSLCLGNARRRIEWLAWHTLLHKLRPDAEVKYNEIGAPILVGGGYIGVSHTADYVAVMLSQRVCGVDIELKNRNFTRAASKFVTTAEMQIIEGKELSVEPKGVVWCAKEVAYKCSGMKELDFLRDINVVGWDSDHQRVEVEVRGESMMMQYLIHDDLIIVHSL